jgi:flagellar hook-associated protein 2
MPNSTWIGSLNVDQFVLQQMQRESLNIDKVTQPQVDFFTKKQSIIKQQQSAFSGIQALLTNFQQNLTQLTTALNPSYQIGYSDSTKINGVITGAVSAGTHTIVVGQLAKSQSVASNVLSSGSTNEQGIQETMDFSIGPVNSPTSSFSVAVNYNDSLQSIADSINGTSKNNGNPITASVLSTSEGQYQLVISSNNTGIANQVNVSELVTEGTGLQISTDGSGQQGTMLSTAQDAQFTYDNLSFDQASNSNVIQGVNVTLLGLGSSTMTLTGSNQVTAVATAIGSIVSTYNQIVTQIQQAKVQVSNPDPHLQLILSTLETAMQKIVVGSNNINQLSDIAITPTKTPQTITVQLADADKGTVTAYVTGLYTLDTDLLTAKLSTNFTDIQSLLADSVTGIFNNISTNLLASGTGSVWKSMNDPTAGAVNTTSAQLAKVNKQLSDAQDKSTALKKDLKLKYAKLDVALTNMQNTSDFLAAQLQSMGK